MKCTVNNFVGHLETKWASLSFLIMHLVFNMYHIASKSKINYWTLFPKSFFFFSLFFQNRASQFALPHFTYSGFCNYYYFCCFFSFLFSLICFFCNFYLLSLSGFVDPLEIERGCCDTRIDSERAMICKKNVLLINGWCIVCRAFTLCLITDLSC